jgi:hypothetical protein
MKQAENNPGAVSDVNVVLGWSLVASNECEAARKAFHGADPLHAAVAKLGLLECTLRERNTSEAKALSEDLAATRAIDYLFDYFPAIARHRQRQRG